MAQPTPPSLPPRIKLAVIDVTGAFYPNAIFVVWGLQLVLRNGQTPSGEFEVRGYVDDNALATGMEPWKQKPPEAFTQEEIAQLQAQFQIAVVNILAQRQEYAGGIVVTV